MTSSESINLFVRCAFEPSDIVEVRSLPNAASSWHTAEELAGQTATLTELNRNGQNIYVGINPRKTKGGTAAKDVALARTLFVDFDGPTPSEVSERIGKTTLPEPTLIVASGHGTHCYWRLAEPIFDLALWSQLQRGLIALLYSDKAIHDAPRIMRLPGFQNVKSDPVPCNIVSADPARQYQLTELASQIPEVKRPAHK